MNLGWILILAAQCLFFPVGHDCERICVSCTNMANINECQHFVTCKLDEICFVQKYRTQDNKIRYDMGCTYPETCEKDLNGQILGKRASHHTHVICQSCCNSTNICNIGLDCNDVQGSKCLSCSEVGKPDRCDNTTFCSKDEVCFLHKYETESGIQHYDLGCKHYTLCRHGSITSVFGRSSEGRHFICESCCSGIECNLDLQCDHHNQKTINSSCSLSSECSGSLICSAGSCQCPSDDYYWDTNTKHCYKRKTAEEMCTEKSQCIDILECNKYICSCPFSTYWNGSTCESKKSVNSSCSSLDECQSSLFCINRKCRCDPIVEYWSGTSCIPLPKECADVTAQRSGVYIIYPKNYKTPVSVYCLIENGNKWTVIQSRSNMSVNFQRHWIDYKVGFGSANGEYWLGNENIHLISNNGRHQLSIYMEIADGSHRSANYSTFRIEDENNKYVLTCTGYSGDAGDCMSGDNDPSNGQKFSTYDQDNDSLGNCVGSSGGGWWYGGCHCAYLNAKSGYHWDKWGGSQSRSIMMIKKAN